MLQNSTRRQLGQSRPATTSAASIYTPSGPNALAYVDCIVVTNTTASTVTYSIYHDADGSTYTDDTVLYASISLSGQATDTILLDDAPLAITNGGNLAVQSGTGNAVNFTVYGAEKVD